MQLMIVESPNKCKKISKILGAGWVVKASVGHIRDLPTKELGVDPENNFRPAYVVSEGKYKVVSDLKAAAASASVVWIATDPDREGEAIAYHIRTVLGLKDNYKRITFSEITEKAIKSAINNPRKLDMPMIAAQETRRSLDRLFGYIASPELQKQSSAGMSAGRVQSPTVGLVVDRERAISSFVSRNHYGAEITLENGLTLKLDTKPFQDEDGLVQDSSVIDDELNSFTQVTIVTAEAKEKHIGPKPPFTTSELQQVASTKLGFSPDQTMKLAQKLFEDGRITYHRTDDPNLSDDAWQMIADYLEAEGIPKSDKRRKWKAKDANAQEAHEGIRPSDIADTPSGTDKLYRLIYERALAAVAADGIDFVTQVVATPVRDTGEPTQYKASGKVVQAQGWRELITIETGESKDKELPCVPEVNEVCQVAEAGRLDQVTKPPARFTEATLVKELEKRGIGRPSTYASIFSTVFRRQYLEVGKGRQITPTALGCAVVDVLQPLEFMNYEYTANLEEQLDRMAQGQLKLIDVARPAYDQLLADLPKIKVNQEQISAFETEGQENCPKCGNAIKRLPRKDNPKKFFWVHASEDHGEACEKFIEDMSGKPYFADLVTHTCRLCGGELERRYSKDKKSHFWAHAAQSNCAKRFYDDRSGKPVLDAQKCPGCQQPIKRLKSKNKDAKTGKFSYFWVHINGAHADVCEKYINDEKGKPTVKSASRA